jgi:hypothetical protein
MINRGPGYLVELRFGSSPTHSLTPSPVNKLDRRHTGRLRKRDSLMAGKGGGLGAESYDCKKAWSSVNHSILSAVPTAPQHGINWQIGAEYINRVCKNAPHHA